MNRFLLLFFRSLWIIAVLFTLSCANIVAPSGGPSDRTAPSVSRSKPENKAIGFADDKIMITFNEFITLEDAAGKAVISPPLDKAPEYRYRGKNLIIALEAPLRENTTYSIDFSDAIRDITEGNITRDFRYVFSTAGHIDSLNLKGAVYDAYSLEGQKDIQVFLYRSLSDSASYLQVPDFVAKSGASGSFDFSNMPAGSYRIFALKDLNANMLYDQPGEKIAFIDSLVLPVYIPRSDSGSKPVMKDTLNQDSLPQFTIKKYPLALFEEVDSSQRLLKVTADHPGRLRMNFRWPVKDLQIRFLKQPLNAGWKMDESNTRKDSLTLWLYDPAVDSLFLEISDGGKIIDTVEVGMKTVADSAQKPRNKSGKGVSDKDQPFKAVLSANASDAKTFDFHRLLVVECLHPVRQLDSSKVLLSEIIDSAGKVVPFSLFFSDSGVNRKLCFQYTFKEKTRYELLILPGAFSDIYGLTSDSLLIRFTTTESEDYGLLKMNLKFSEPEPPYLFQLIGDNKQILQEQRILKSGSFSFSFMKPGNYTARIIVDSNDNGAWDSGRYLKKRQPEKVYNYPGVISIKANWDTEIDWEL